MLSLIHIYVYKRQDDEIAETLVHGGTEDLKIVELKRQKLLLKDEIERLRHDHSL